MSDVKSSVTPRRLTLVARLKSFGYALQGIAFMLKTQHNAWLHGVATIAVIVLAVYCHVSASDWRWLIVAMGMVWVGETINTAVEYVCDVVSPDYNHAIKHAKDIAAGGVLIAAVASLVIGVLTFLPYFP
jgi:diacylglycerol kinase (ATP)